MARINLFGEPIRQKASLIRGALAAGICALGLALPTQWASAEVCTPIRFAAGHTSVVVEGDAPADDVVCYALTTRQGQRAELKVVSGANTIFGIDGLVDARDAYRFTTERKTYRVEVGQLMRATAPERFALRVSVQ